MIGIIFLIKITTALLVIGTSTPISSVKCKNDKAAENYIRIKRESGTYVIKLRNNGA